LSFTRTGRNLKLKIAGQEKGFTREEREGNHTFRRGMQGG
jgi:hypothetical protein